jgi:endoglucanase
MTLPSSSGAVFSDSAATGGRALLIWSNATATGSASTVAARRIAIRARGDQCAGAPHMSVRVDGREVLAADVAATAWTTYAANVALADGAHTIAVAFTNDAMATGCDRNLRVDDVSFSSTAAAPLAGAKLYVEPGSDAAKQAAAWRTTRPADAAQMDKIAAQPQARWLGGWSGDIATATSAITSAAAAAGAVPVLVAYNIPQRDCGGYSAGGVGSPDAYRTWIRGFASGIGSRRAVVILEPDALAGMDCLSAADRDVRLRLLRDAVSVLAARPGVSVYLDGGNARWHTAADTADRLRRAGIENAQGFALNVSNFISTSESATYGRAVAAATGGKHFVVDTSRNGLGPAPDGAWCNPPGRALGARPTAATGEPLQDADLWVKHPGESDGTCNGGPAAGTWWAEAALDLARRAAY